MPLQDKVRLLSQFNAWRSEDNFVWPANGFFMSEDIDCTYNAKGIQLWPVPVLQFSIDPAHGNIQAIAKNPQTDDLWYFTSDGRVYKNSVYTATASIVGVNILNAIPFTNDRIIIITINDIYQLNLTTDTTTIIGALSYTWIGVKRPAVVFADSLYFGNGNQVRVIDSTLLTNLSPIVLLEGEVIVYMSAFIDQIKIYSHQIFNNPGDAYQYVWDGVSDFVQYINYIPNAEIVSWATDSGTDYIAIDSSYSNLYAFSWVQKQLIFSWIKWNFDATPFGTNQQVGLAKDNCVYMIGNSVTWWNNGLYKLWKPTNVSPYSLSFIGSQITPVYEVIYSFGRFIYAASDKNVYRIFTGGGTLNAIYPTTWYIDTLEWFGDTMSQLKKLNRIKIAYQLANGTTIQIRASFDGDSYILLDTITDTSSRYKEVYANSMTTIPYFNYMKYRITLTSSVNSNTPILFEIATFYEDIEQ